MVRDREGGFHRGWPAPGTIVSVPYLVFWKHKGIVSDCRYRGKPTVISNSGRYGCVVEEPWDDFAQGQVPAVEGYPGRLPPARVVARARSLIGTPYRLLDWNCEHLVRYAHGLKPESPQVAGTVMLLGVGVVLMASRRS